MSVMVELKPGADRAGFVERLEATGLFWRDFPMIPSLFSVEFVTAADFPLRDDTAVARVTDDSYDAVKPLETVTIEELPTSGAWGLLRHTRRKRPWPNGLSLPYSDEFECVRSGLGVDVYVVDSGCRVTHTEFGGRAVNLDTWTTIYFHGTACAGVAAGATTGFARDAAVFNAAGLRNSDGSGSAGEITASINAVLAHYRSRQISNRPAVLNLSFASTSDSYAAALTACVAAGIVCVASAGNDRWHLATNNTFPAETTDMLCAGATNMDDGPMNVTRGGTNFGKEVDLLAAGQQVRAPLITGDSVFGSVSGTSFSAPYIVGMIACVLQDYARLTSAAQVRAVIEYMYETATFGEYQPDPRFVPMTGAIAYLDPGPGPYPPVPGLVLYPRKKNEIKAVNTAQYTVLGPSPNAIKTNKTLVYNIVFP